MIVTNSDGGARGNPGPGAVGIVLRYNGAVVKKIGKYIGKTTNNVAEYKALIMALEEAIKHSKEVKCILDSELVVKQILGKYQVKDLKLKSLFLETQRLINKFEKIEFEHTKRDDPYQAIADELVNNELNKRGYLKKEPLKNVKPLKDYEKF